MSFLSLSSIACRLAYPSPCLYRSSSLFVPSEFLTSLLKIVTSSIESELSRDSTSRLSDSVTGISSLSKMSFTPSRPHRRTRSSKRSSQPRQKVRIIDESIETAVTHIVSLIFRNTHSIVELAAYLCLLSISYRISTSSPIPLRRNLESFATSANSSSKRSTVASRSTSTSTSNTASGKIKMYYECRLLLPSRSPLLSHPRSHASSHRLHRPLCSCQILETCCDYLFSSRS